MNIKVNGGYLGKEGLCYMFREMIKELSKNHDIRIDSQYSPKVDGYWAKFFGDFEDKKQESIYLMNGHTTFLPELAKKHKNIIALTVFETDLPEDWVNALNIPEVKEVWTISEFGKRLILKNGVTKPVKVVYLGVDKRFHEKQVNLFPKDKSFKFFKIESVFILIT